MNKEIPLEPSTIELIDLALFEFIKDKLDIHCTTNQGWKKVPVSWVLPEKSFQIKDNKELRDNTGQLILPLIAVQRSNMEKNPSKKGEFWGHIDRDERGGSITIAYPINQEKTSDFTNNNVRRIKGVINFPKKIDKVVYQTISMPMPAYIDITYSIHIMTDYQQQMNEIVTPFISYTGGINYYPLRKNGHIYPLFIQQEFKTEHNVNEQAEETRIYKTSIEIKCLGYVIGDGNNQTSPKKVFKESPVEIRMPKERVIMGDIPEWKDGHYRE